VTRATQRKTQRAPSSAGDGDGRTMRLVKQVGVVVGVVSGVVGWLFLCFPGLRPQDSGPSNADQLPAISSVDVLPRVTQGAFLASHDRSTAGFTKEQLAALGAAVSEQLQIYGYRGKHLPLEHQVLDARTHDPVSTARSFVITPDVDKVSRPWWEWFPLPKARGSYYVEVKLFDDRKTVMACTPSASFGGLAGFTRVASPKSC